MALRQVITYVDDATSPDAPPPDANPAGDVPATGGADAPPPGYDEWLIHFEYFLAHDPRAAAMMGGGGEAPPEGGDLGAPAAPAMPEPGEQNSMAGRALRGAAMGGLKAGAIGGAIAGPFGAGTAGPVGAAVGGIRGAMHHQDSTIPVAYAAEINSLKRTVQQLVDRDKQKEQVIQNLSGTNAIKDAELQATYLANQGLVALYKDDHSSIDPKKFTKLVNDLASMPDQHRHAKVQEMSMYWEKDEALAYAAAGAPIGNRFVSDQKTDMVIPGERKFTEAHLKKANEYLKANRNATWEQAEQYAMNGQVVHG